jgi:hypothetical protein
MDYRAARFSRTGLRCCRTSSSFTELTADSNGDSNARCPALLLAPLRMSMSFAARPAVVTCPA